MLEDRHDRRLYARLRQQLADGLELLPDKPEETVDTTLRALWLAAAGHPLSAARAADMALPMLDDDATRSLDGLVRQRLQGTPLAHVTGRQQFAGLEMLASSEALVPRHETELLAHAAIKLAHQLAVDTDSVHVLDTCTGSGNVALAIAAQVPATRVSATDLDPDAIELAQRNAEYLELAHRVHFASGDLLQAFDSAEYHGKIDLLTCNPPYISSARVAQMNAEISAHEPHLAFDGGPLGVSILMRLVSDAPRFLRTGGWLAFEVGLGQGPSMLKRLQRNPAFSHVEGVEDDQDAVRVIIARH